MSSFSAKNTTLISLFCTLLIQLSISASAKCHVDDESGLLAFKKGIISDPSGWLSKWESGTDCCTWSGVRCSYANNRVIGLTLELAGNSNSFLTGTISPSLSKLTQLEGLFLVNLKNLSGSFPSLLLSLPNIQYVYIENSKLSGKLPENFGKLSKLVGLSLAGNRISGPIPSSIGGLSELQNLWLDNNLLTGRIPASFKALKNIFSLRLNNNKLSGAIPDFFTASHNLYSLKLQHNNLSGNIPRSMAALAPRLRELSLGHNVLSGKIPDFLGKFSLLKSLDLSWNKFAGLITALPKTFINLTLLFYLELSHNSLVDPFPQINFEGIRLLDLSYNKFHLVNVSEWVTPNLYSLKLAKCGLKLKMDYFKYLENYLFYEYLDLSENEITGSPVELLDSSYFLVGFYASGNKLKFDLGSLKIANTLKDLDISRNSVFGKVPKEVAGLRLFNASHNHLCGQLPATKFAASAFAGNDCLCGSPLPACKA